MAYTEQLNPSPRVSNPIRKLFAGAGPSSIVDFLVGMFRAEPQKIGSLNAQTLQDTAARTEYRDYANARHLAKASGQHLHRLADQACWQLPR